MPEKDTLGKGANPGGVRTPIDTSQGGTKKDDRKGTQQGGNKSAEEEADGEREKQLKSE